MLSFEVRKTGGDSEVRKVHRDVIHIGASTGNDLVVRARGVLGRHARISVSGDELRLDVLGAAPGSEVLLNGSIVKTAALAAGDRIQIGEATITLLNGPPPNPNRISAPPPRGRDALSAAAAALSPAPPAPAPAAPAAYGSRPPAPPARPLPPPPAPAFRPDGPGFGASGAAAGTVPEGRPRWEGREPAAPPPPRPHVPEDRRPHAPAVRSLDWSELYGLLSRPVGFDELLQDLASWLASSTPVHSIAFTSLDESGAEVVAAIWKGSLPRLSARAVTETREKGVPQDVFEGGARLRLYPIVRSGSDPTGLLVLPLDLASDPGLNEMARLLAASIAFAHQQRGEGAIGQRGPAPAPAVPPVTLEDPLAALVGGSIAIQNLKASLQRVASVRAPILLLGDVGTGKTLVAEILHALSPRRPRPLVRIAATAATAAALEEDLLGSPGTSSDRRRRTGRLFEADGGTLLIEEVGDLPLPTQALLFRLLEAREVVGPGGRSVPLDVRVICTSSRPLTRAVEDGAFRDDLYYRVSSLTLRLPALKDRKEDIPSLLDAFAGRHASPTADRFDVEAMNALLGYTYPGNVRELENEARRLAAQHGNETVGVDALDDKFSGEHVELALTESDDLKEIVEKVERQVIERVMRKVRGNQSLGARLLNISRGSLIAKMKEYEIKDYRYLRRNNE